MRFVFLLALLLHGLAPSLQAWDKDEPGQVGHPGIPRVERVMPRGWHAGGKVEVKFTGSRLMEPAGILCLTTNKISASNFKVLPGIEKKPETEGTGVTADLEIAPDCPPGQHALRLYTNSGIGEVTTFWVGSLGTVREAELFEGKSLTDTNGTIETAEKIPTNSTINGALLRTESDAYCVDVKKGQLLTVAVECARLCNSERDDGSEIGISVRDASGKTLASSDESTLFLNDPLLSLHAPADGPLYVFITALLAAGDGKSILHYRLHVGDFPQPQTVYPAGGKPGETISVRDTAGGATYEVKLPQETGFFPWRAAAQTPSPNRLRVFAGPNVLEVEPNDSTEQAAPASQPSPVAFNGILEKPGDVDVFKFTAKKGDRLMAEAHAQSVGSAADLQIAISSTGKDAQNEKAEDSGDNELNLFESATIREKLDPRLVFTAKEDGEYFLTVTDARDLGGANFVYRVELGPVPNGSLTSLAYVDRNARGLRNAINVAQGNRIYAGVLVRPVFGAKFDGDLILKAEGLPKGVRMIAPPIKPGMNRVSVLFEADPDAPVAAAAVKLRAEPAQSVPGWVSGCVHSIPLVITNNDAIEQITLDSIAVAVTRAAPFHLEATLPDVPLSKNSESEIEVKLTRAKGYTEEVDVSIEPPPQGINAQTGLKFEGETTTLKLRLGVDGSVTPGKYQLCVTARNRSGDGKTGAGKMYSSSQFLELEITDPYVRIKLAKSAVQRGQKLTVKGTIERLRDLPGNATATLIRLPRGLSMSNPSVPLPAEGTEIAFEIEAAPDALVGTYSTMACELSMESAGRVMKQVVGSGILRVDPARN